MSLVPLPLSSTLFPYTTLFRSGAVSRAARSGDVFCASERQVGGVKLSLPLDRSRRAGAQHAAPLQERNNQERKSRILYQAPARGSAHVLPLRRPNGAPRNGMPSKGMSLGSPQISPASFAPNQVAAATPWPAKPAAKYLPSIFPACGITSTVKSSVPPQTNSIFVSRSCG